MQMQEKQQLEPEQVLIPALFGQEYSNYFEMSA
jgi:hypothetical protein